MRYLRAIVWWALLAVLLGVGAIAVAIWWPERATLTWALGLGSISMAVLSLREERTG